MEISLGKPGNPVYYFVIADQVCSSPVKLFAFKSFWLQFEDDTLQLVNHIVSTTAPGKLRDYSTVPKKQIIYLICAVHICVCVAVIISGFGLELAPLDASSPENVKYFQLSAQKLIETSKKVYLLPNMTFPGSGIFVGVFGFFGYAHRRFMGIFGEV